MMMMMAANSVRWGGDTEDDEDIIINEQTVNAAPIMLITEAATIISLSDHKYYE